MKANISLSPLQILSIGGNTRGKRLYMNVNLESALRLRQYPGAVSWLQAALANLDPGKQVGNKSSLGMHREPLFICNLSFSENSSKESSEASYG